MIDRAIVFADSLVGIDKIAIMMLNDKQRTISSPASTVSLVCHLTNNEKQTTTQNQKEIDGTHRFVIGIGVVGIPLAAK